ncbi:hypothetical protein DFH28DRAFT_1116788 [Melampsora americana]|nr:hypothetical protein DFH28DRAFT_1116788 [Melampsora americana]
MENLYEVGLRIILDHLHFGTIRCVGHLNEKDNQIWLGIEWDDPERGKHSGSFQNRSFFQTKVPGSATFIRPSPRIGLGHSFLSALKAKYVEQEEPCDPLDPHSIRLDRVSTRFKQLDRLRLVGLESAEINGAGSKAELEELDGLLSNLETLNLSFNLFRTLTDVAQIIEKLPKLKTLILNSNRMEIIPDTLKGLRNLRCLYLEATCIQWHEAVAISAAITELSELHIARCGFGRLGGIPKLFTLDPFPYLSTLTLDENGLSDWLDMISTLSGLHRLETLNLRRNLFSIISLISSETVCQSVRHLNLTHNQITKGEEIERLAQYFPSLESLWILGNPIYNGYEDRSARLLTIARLPGLVNLESSKISSAEKIEADLFYWSLITKESGDEASLRSRHSRYNEFVQRFGPHEVISVSTKTTSNIKSRMIHVKVLWPCETDEPHTIEVLPTMPLRAFRARLMRMFGKASKALPDPFRLVLIGSTKSESVGDESFRMELDDLTKSLEWYGILDGDLVKIEAL